MGQFTSLALGPGRSTVPTPSAACTQPFAGRVKLSSSTMANAPPSTAVMASASAHNAAPVRRRPSMMAVMRRFMPLRPP